MDKNDFFINIVFFNTDKMSEEYNQVIIEKRFVLCLIPDWVLCMKRGLDDVLTWTTRRNVYLIGNFEITIVDNPRYDDVLLIKWAKTKYDPDIKLQIDQLDNSNTTFEEFLCKMAEIARKLAAEL